jgi:putative nucleotidyltransferase with HDIG domain
VALLFLVFFNSLAGLAVGHDIHSLFYILMTNLLGILAVARAAQRVGVVVSGFKLGLAAIGLFVLVQMSNQGPLNWSTGIFGTLLAFLSGPLTAGLLVFALPLCERLFSVTTEIRLSELGNVNLPLLRQLILKAPGTYNHSIAVGTLAEGAAKAIGLNPLFARVACLYHDIGKSLQPEYFIENQQGGNPHDPLSPEESVRIVAGHVIEGIRLAERAGLPPAIVDIIPQHHGTKLLVPFYAKARRLAGGEESKVQEDRFRYPGPKPQSKEAAIIMLADGVEASARTLEDRSQERLLELIRKIVSAAAEDGQFSDCEITLAELERVTFSFLETLSSFYHSRITYPGFDFTRKAPHDAKAAKG